MHFEYAPEDEAFRQEVRQFFKDNLPPDIARRAAIGAHPPLKDDVRTWQGILHRKGWGAPHWPKEYGGVDWSPVRKHIFMEELYNADGLDYGWQSLHMVAPVLIAFGSEWQKQRFLPSILSGEEFWCQGFSEPNAGSDLANLRTTAVLDGDEYVINGQKVWTSDAVQAEWGFFLVRTDTTVKPQRGISFILVKMDTPGITVRPIISIEGGRGLNEVFLDNVRVPRSHLVGEPGMGWTYAKYLLGKERTTSAFLYFNKRELERVREIARGELVDGLPLLETPEFARKLARVETDLLALEWSVLRVLAEENNRHNADAVVSALKVRGSLMQQRVTELQVDAMGPRALRFYEHDEDSDTLLWPSYVPGRTAGYLIARASTIYGGALEVQKNIIARLAFGL
ncbi:alkylation response protein AidB-like acyl-CoA dehydrogenase [Herbaspirillum rubrisubalbicans]|uniref:acyl-CoA dehydrogenase family protein n=1 Tax=Herbaspirillum rubrisubalbicans TaxID=80842 RepID=UPI00209DB170|nr:acyl-CoA dehydrogenase family protein [Herbaspirillum rubrisubalbicans]MCP1572899.1 alkylation response protein AidB-like acyl-CoA dehydrogenase [Herbaspirillum rubrisubalbicans]